MAKIVIVDDHPIVCEGLIELIDQKGRGELTVVGQASDAEAALDVIKTTRPDMAIVDIFLKGSDGIDLVKRIKTNNSRIDILVLSMHDESLYAERAIDAGSDGYVMKDEKPSDIIDAIRRVLKGQIYLSDKMATRLLRRKTPGGAEKSETSITLLTDRELEVFRLLGLGWTTRQIAKELHLSIKTVETYFSRIKEKLNLPNANELIRHAVQWLSSGQL